ncbi:MAG TPA: group II intron reverse transcriptase/maturase [Thermoanaerobaculia bacterium]|nr:group II intron reverse transcriptase/maturase [Thermoanaerobaculia bacterium]
MPYEDAGEARGADGSGEALRARRGNERSGTDRLMEEVVGKANLKAALKRVRQNKGGPGIDGMTVGELPEHLRREWIRIREELLAGTYRPQPVKRQTIPKAGGGERELGIPTVLDRFLQQALLQVLQPRWDPGFSDHSYGFRPKRRAHQAIERAQSYVQAGRRVVVDVDLAKFFDRANHDIVMERVARKIADKRVLGLIRRYLEAGVMVSGVVVERREGTPQGGPLSPLLANVLLDEVDKELEKRGHAFVRYADDLNVYVRTKAAGERVYEGLKKLFGRLRLVVNEDKSAVDLAWRRDFLGYSFWVAEGRRIRRRVAGKALEAMKQRVREITNRNGGRSLTAVAAELKAYLTGWREYFQQAETPGVFRDLDGWVRHRLRCLQLKQWKRGTTAYRELRAQGASSDTAARVAANTQRWWRTSALLLNSVLTNRFFDELGVPRLAP